MRKPLVSGIFRVRTVHRIRYHSDQEQNRELTFLDTSVRLKLNELEVLQAQSQRIYRKRRIQS